ncbi:MAG: alpha-ketoglutarate-dependent dioxygenase AlkB [Armatimonadetes bacterium]|nr:alpha-ketoglutarate-dependent dioxygenase AlkB [Armatimonadota bacterium]
MPDYISEEEETQLLHEIDANTWSTELSRRVQHYGYKYDYKARQIDPTMHIGDLPDWLQKLAHRLHQENRVERPPDQVIVNEYLPGQGIAPHIDCEPCFGGTIATLSLGSTAVMEFANETEKLPIVLEQRSLTVLKGDARYNWTHAIAKRKKDVIERCTVRRARRVSLTFRLVVM